MAGYGQYGRPRPVERGLTARSTRGGIGEQWWSRRFIEVLESFSLGTRLTRGRAYARKGQVISLEIETAVVTAQVQGSRVTPYRVRIGLKKFTELVWAKVEVALAEQALFSAQLLAGEFPRELEPVLAQIGAPMFPQRLADLDLRCSCPDQAVPCKHIAAVFYLLAERFDDDPFLLLHWRGRSREALLDRLRALRGDSAPSDPEGGSPGTDAPTAMGEPDSGALNPGAALALQGLFAEPEAAGRKRAKPGPAGGDAVSFWTAGPLPPLPNHPELPPDLLLRQLPVPGAGIGGSGLIDGLGEVYRALGPTQ